MSITLLDDIEQVITSDIEFPISFAEFITPFTPPLLGTAGGDTFTIDPDATGNITVEARGGTDTLVLDGIDIDLLQVGYSGPQGYDLLTFGDLSITVVTGPDYQHTLDDPIELVSFRDGDGALITVPYQELDYIRGTSGDEYLVGPSNEQGVFIISDGADTLEAGPGGTGSLRTSTYSNDFAVQDAVVDLTQGTFTGVNFAQTLIGFQYVRYDTVANDAATFTTLIGDEQDNELTIEGWSGLIEGRAGDDSLELRSANGTMDGGDGDDRLFVSGEGFEVSVEGGNGSDTLILSGRPGDALVSTNEMGQAVIFLDSTDTGTLTLMDEIETIRFNGVATYTYSEFIDEFTVTSLTGTDMGEVITGTTGSEQINALGGNDWITTGGGSDTVDGGGGIDMISFVDARSVRVNLETGGAGVTFEDASGEYTQNGTSLRNIENVTGTSRSDLLVGDSGTNILRGLGGSDTFILSGARDLIQGGAGRDSVWVAGSADSTISLLRGRVSEGLGTDTRLQSIESIRAASGDDMLTGDHATNRLYGRSGDDTLMGNGGDDLLYGGFGEDIALYSYAQDQYEVSTTERGITTVDYIGAGAGDGTDLLVQIETLRFADGDLIL